MKQSHLLLKGRDSQPFHYYVITTVTHQRKPLFTELAEAKKVIVELYRLEQEKAIKNISFCLMPDHLHWQFQLLNKLSLSDTVKRLKGRTSKYLNELNKTSGKIWQKGYFEHQIRNEEDLIIQARYIVANPLRANIVNNVCNYPYWNCVYL